MFTRKQYKRRKRQVKITSQIIFRKRFKRKNKKEKKMLEMKLEDQFPWGACEGKTLKEVIDKNYYYFNMALDKEWIKPSEEALAYAKESEGFYKATKSKTNWNKFLNSQKD